MKVLWLVLPLLFLVLPVHAGILVNDKFADGRAHWKGDAQDPDVAGDLLAPTQSGVSIRLKKDKWTKIYQTFITHVKKLKYNITFKLSPDYFVKPLPAGFASASGATPGLDDMEGIYPLYLSQSGTSWTVVAYDGGASNYIQVQPDVKKKDSQSLSGEIGGFNSENEKVILLAFPPGEGTVTLSELSLSPSE